MKKDFMIAKTNILVLWEPTNELNKKNIYRLAVRNNDFAENPRVKFLHNNKVYDFFDIDKNCFMYCTVNHLEKRNNNLHTLVHNGNILHKKGNKNIEFDCTSSIFVDFKDEIRYSYSQLLELDKKLVQMQTKSQTDEEENYLDF